MKDKPKQGFLKEIGKTQKPEIKKPFDYKRPVNKQDNPNNMSINSRQRAQRSVPQDKTTNFKSEAAQARASHKPKGN